MHDNLTQQSLALAQEILQDRKRQRRFSLLSKLFWLILIGVVVVSLSNQGEETGGQPHIAVVSLIGPVFSDTPAGSKSVVEQLTSAFKNPQANIILVEANSPGGAPAQASIINDAIIRLKTQYKKPIYTVVSDLCASACYYALANTDRIYVNNVSLVGSIGVRLESYDIQQLAEKIGVKQRLLTAGEHKAFLNPFQPVEPAAKKHLQQTINETHQAFIDVVKQGRGDRLSDQKNLFSGLLWSGTQSIKIGLSDELSDLHTLSQQEFKLPLRYYAPQAHWLEKLTTLSIESDALLPSTLAPFLMR